MESVRLARPWGPHPAGALLALEAAPGVAAVVDEGRLAALRRDSYAAADAEGTLAAPARGRKGARGGH